MMTAMKITVIIIIIITLTDAVMAAVAQTIAYRMLYYQMPQKHCNAYNMTDLLTPLLY